MTGPVRNQYDSPSARQAATEALRLEALQRQAVARQQAVIAQEQQSAPVAASGQGSSRSQGEPIVLEIDGRLVEFPDLATAQAFVVNRARRDQSDSGAGSPQIDAATDQPMAARPPRADSPTPPPAPPEPRSVLYENFIGAGAVDTPGEVLGDAIGAAGSGMVRGGAALLDLPAQVERGMAGLLGRGADAMVGAVTGEDTGNLFETAAQSMPGMFGQGGGGRALAEGILGSEVVNDRGKTRTARLASTVGEFLPGAMMAGGSGAILPYAVAPGVMSEGAGELAQGHSIPEVVPGIGGMDAEPMARVAAALLGPSVFNAGARAMTPNPADPARTQIAELLSREGVRTTAGQRTGNGALVGREQMAGRTSQIMADQSDDFTAAALRRIGVDARRADPEVMAEAYRRIGGTFDDLAARNSITPDMQLADDVRAALGNYGDLTTRQNMAPVISRVSEHVDDALSGGQPITGQQYQSMRTSLGRATRSPDTALRTAAQEVLAALDDALGRTMQAAGNTDDLALYQQARQQYRDFLAIERAVSGAGAETAMGVISPARLRAATVSQDRRGYVTGRSELGELARGGTAMIGQGGNPSTRQSMSEIMRGLNSSAAGGGLGGAAAYALTRDPATATAIGLLSTQAPAAGRFMTATRPGQAYLGNQMATQRAELLGSGGASIGTTSAAVQHSERLREADLRERIARLLVTQAAAP